MILMMHRWTGVQQGSNSLSELGLGTVLDELDSPVSGPIGSEAGTASEFSVDAGLARASGVSPGVDGCSGCPLGGSAVGGNPAESSDWVG